MRVNSQKTQLLCISATLNSGDSILESSDSMTLLGFNFSNRPTMSLHLELIKKKFNCRIWLIRHLKQAGLPQKDLATIFATVIRPVIEYAAPVYHPLITSSQSEELEKMQRKTIKVIYGHRMSYRKALEEAAIPTLEERRQNIFEKFTKKLVSNNGLKNWFPEQEAPKYALRQTNKYKEYHANTDPLFRSPLYTMRRLANKM